MVFLQKKCNAAFRITFAMSIQYLLFCSTFDLLCDEEKRQQTFEYLSLFFKLG